jgi:hypothetical protein
MYNITNDMIEEQFTGCVYCGEPQGDKFGCCKENHFDTITIIDIYAVNDIDGKMLDQGYYTDDEFNIVEPHDLTTQEKNDILGSLERDIKGDR